LWFTGTEIFFSFFFFLLYAFTSGNPVVYSVWHIQPSYQWSKVRK